MKIPLGRAEAADPTGIIINDLYLLPCSTPSLQNLAVPHDFYYSLGINMWYNLGDIVLDGVGLAGFKSRPNAF